MMSSSFPRRMRPVLCVLGWCLLACSSSKGAPTADDFGERFKLAGNDIPGWTPSHESTAYSVWTPDNLNLKIDGAAYPYINDGMRFAMYQDLVGTGTRLCTLTAMDFVTAEAALKIFADKTKFLGDMAAVGSFDAGTAVGSPGLTSLTVYAHFDANYFEVLLDGYTSQDAASSDADPFLKAMQKKSQ